MGKTGSPYSNLIVGYINTNPGCSSPEILNGLGMNICIAILNLFLSLTLLPILKVCQRLQHSTVKAAKKPVS